MGRRILAITALLAGALTLSPVSPASAESGGGTSTATRSAMGQIAAGDRTNCTVVNERVACWGANFHGQVGDGTFNKRTMVTFVPGLTGVQ